MTDELPEFKSCFVAEKALIDERTKNLSLINIFEQARAKKFPVLARFDIVIETRLKNVVEEDIDFDFILTLFSDPKEAIPEKTVSGKISYVKNKKKNRLIINFGMPVKEACKLFLSMEIGNKKIIEKQLLSWSNS